VQGTHEGLQALSQRGEIPLVELGKQAMQTVHAALAQASNHRFAW